VEGSLDQLAMDSWLLPGVLRVPAKHFALLLRRDAPGIRHSAQDRPCDPLRLGVGVKVPGQSP